MTAPRSEIATDLSLVALAAIWGINFSVMKVVLVELDPLALNALRFPLAVAALALLLRGRTGPTLPDTEDLPRILLLGVLGNVVYQLCFIFGIDGTGAGNASLLLSTTPVWTVLLSAFAGHERATPAVVVGVVGTVVGMTFVVLGRGDEISLSSATLRGDLLMVLASILWSLYTVGGRGAVAKYGPVKMTAWTLWVGTPCLVAIGLPSVMRTDLATLSFGAWMGVIYTGLLSIGLAYLIWYRGVQRLGNTRTAAYSNLVPIAALITAWAWLGEVPTRIQLLGATIILIGLTLARVAIRPVRSPADGESRETRSR